jgi:small subunit ribosomal protein S4e
MARGLIKHMKRLNAPKHWMLSKLGGIWAPRASTGPHKLRECLPLSIILRNRLKLSLNRRETNTIVMKRKIQVDGKVRTDLNYPAGLMDVVSIPDTKENFRLIYDVKGRFTLTAVTAEQAQFKLCRIVKVDRANKASSGRNPFFTGQKAVVPYAVTHDGRTLRFIDPTVKVGDTVKIDIKTSKVKEIYKFSMGKIALISGGKNVGRVGQIVSRDRHPGGFDIVHLKDSRGNEFATRVSNVFVIGEKQGDDWTLFMKLAKGNGVKRSIQEQYEFRLKKQAKQ